MPSTGFRLIRSGDVSGRTSTIGSNALKGTVILERSEPLERSGLRLFLSCGEIISLMMTTTTWPTLLDRRCARRREKIKKGLDKCHRKSVLKRPEDLKGKKIGVTNLGDSPDLVLSLLLEKWGLQRNKDVAVLGIRGGMPELLISVSKGFVDAGMISAPSNLRGVKVGLREFVNVADLGIPYLNSPLSTRRSYIKAQRDVVLRVLRAYYQAVQETRNDRNSAVKILAKYVRVDDPEILSEVYRIYGASYLQKNLTIDLEGVRGLLNGLGTEATRVDPAVFMDVSLLQDLDREGFFQAKNR